MKFIKIVLMTFALIFSVSAEDITTGEVFYTNEKTDVQVTEYKFEKYTSLDELLKKDHNRLLIAFLGRKGFAKVAGSMVETAVLDELLDLSDIEFRTLLAPFNPSLKAFHNVVHDFVSVILLIIWLVFFGVFIMIVVNSAKSGKLMGNRIESGVALLATLAVTLIAYNHIKTDRDDISAVDGLLLKGLILNYKTADDVINKFNQNSIIAMPAVKVPKPHYFNDYMTNLVDALIMEKANRKSEGDIVFNFIKKDGSYLGTMKSTYSPISIRIGIDEDMIKTQKIRGNENVEAYYDKKMQAAFEMIIVKANKIADNVVQQGSTDWFSNSRNFSYISDSCVDYENVDLSGVNVRSINGYIKEASKCLSQEMIAKLTATPEYKYKEVLRGNYGWRNNYIMLCDSNTAFGNKIPTKSLADIENCVQQYCSDSEDSSVFSCSLATKIQQKAELNALVQDSGYFIGMLSSAYQGMTDINTTSARKAISSFKIVQDEAPFYALNDFQIKVPSSVNPEFNYETYLDFRKDRSESIIDGINLEKVGTIDKEALLSGTDGFAGMDRFFACYKKPNQRSKEGWACDNIVGEMKRFGNNLITAYVGGVTGYVVLNRVSSIRVFKPSVKITKGKSFNKYLNKKAIAAASAVGLSGAALVPIMDSLENESFDIFYGFDDNVMENSPEIAAMIIAMYVGDKTGFSSWVWTIGNIIMFVGLSFVFIIPLSLAIYLLRIEFKPVVAMIEALFGIPVKVCYAVIPSTESKMKHLVEAFHLGLRAVLMPLFAAINVVIAMTMIFLLSYLAILDYLKPYMIKNSISSYLILIAVIVLSVFILLKHLGVIFGKIEEANDESFGMIEGSISLGNSEDKKDGVAEAKVALQRAKSAFK
jgi:uncharacterized protein with FMN-binding domain